MADYSITAVARRVVYSGSAGTGPYAFSFPVLTSSDIDVYKDTAKLTETTDYTVTVSATDGTGSVTLGVAATSSHTITLVGARTVERTTDFVTAGDLLASSLNTELDSLTIFNQQAAEANTRALTAPVTDPTSINMELPAKAARLGKYLAFNSSTGNPEAGAGGDDVTALSAVTTDIATLADIEDGTDATDAIQTVAGVAAHVSTISGISANVSTVAGISSNVTSVAADATDIGAVAAKATEIGRLGTSDAVADLALLGTSAVVTDLDLLGTSANVTAMGLLGTSANVTAMGLLGTSAVVTDLGLLGTSAAVSDLSDVADKATEVGRLGTTDAVADMALLGTSAVVTDLDLLGTSANVTAMGLLGTSANVTAMGLLGTSAVVTDLGLLGTSDAVSDMNVLGTSGNVTNMNTLAGIAANITTTAGVSANVSTVAGISANVSTVAAAAAAINNVASQAIGFTWSNSTTMADPGSGTVRFNNATVGSVTAIAIDDLDSGGADVSPYIITWDDSTNTSKGYLTLRKGGSTTIFAIYRITALTDNSGWSQLTVSHVASGGSWTNGDTAFVDFQRAGDKGADGSGSMTSFTAAGDSGSSQAIVDGNTLTLAGGDGVATVASATDTVTVSADLKSNGGIVIESGELAVDLAASSITNTLAIGDGGTGSTSTTYCALGSNVSGTLPIGSGGTGSTSTTYCALGSNVSGTLPVGSGGTGATTLTANYALLGNGSSAPQMVAPGSSGNVLTSNGSTWASAAAAAGGKVLQVITGTTTTQVDVNSTTLTDTGLTAAITCAATSSKVLVLVSQSVDHNSRSVGRLVIFRGATNIWDAIGVGDTDNQRTYHFIPHLDSPSSTSELTYKTQMSRYDQSGTINIQRNDTATGKSTIVLVEIGA